MSRGVRIPNSPAIDCRGEEIERVRGTVPGLEYVLVDCDALLERIRDIIGWESEEETVAHVVTYLDREADAYVRVSGHPADIRCYRVPEGFVLSIRLEPSWMHRSEPTPEDAARPFPTAVATANALDEELRLRGDCIDTKEVVKGVSRSLTVSDRRKSESESPARKVGRSSRSGKRTQVGADGSWFGVGILRGKTEANHGTLWRSAYQMGASMAFSIGARYNKDRENRADTFHLWSKLPFLQFPDWETFSRSAPYNCPWVAVEMGGVPLDRFEHPPRALYILGSEDQGIDKAVLEACRYCVSLPSVRGASYNVAVAGSIVLYDRMLKAGSHWPNAEQNN